MDRKNLIQLLQEKEQEHLIDYYDQLNREEQDSLAKQIAQIDWNLVEVLKEKEKLAPRGEIKPIKACTKKEISEKREHYEELGLKAIKEGKIAAVLLAGGQGSRLGFDGPKGTVNIGETKDLYIFEMLIRNTMDVVNKANAYIPFYIMTSDKNHKETVAFMEEHNYFGYPKEFVKFFTQEMAPCVDLKGKILMEAKDKIASSPNGNGGWFSSMEKQGIVEEAKKRGVEWLNVFAVDNVLQRICDPCFLGSVLDAGMVSGSKVVRKSTKEERVGVMCLEDNKPSIIEYFEMSQEMLDEKTESGEYAYNYGVTLNYLFKMECLEEILRAKLPVHFAKKKIAYVTADGKKVKPEEPNGYKFELFILDMIHMLENCLPYEVERNKEFAPIKNASGVDSIESARNLLKENGIEI